MRISDWSSDVCSSDLDLIIGPMHDERRHLDFLQIVREVGFRKGLHAVVMRLCTADHALTPPVLDQTLADLCTVALEAVEGPGRDIEVELRTKIGEASCRERVCEYA